MADRYSKFSLSAHERPLALFNYYVTGRGLFPFDMLRYDSCWPSDSESAAKMSMSLGDITTNAKEPRSIQISSFREPTVERWTSFLWSVGKEPLK